MPPRFLLGNLGGVGRVRTARLGYDVTNLGLDARFVTFDSTWPNALRVRASGEVGGPSLGSDTKNYFTYPGPGGASAGYRDIKVLPMAGSGPDRPTIAWVKNYGGTLNYLAPTAPTGAVGTPLNYARGYSTCGVSMMDNQIYLSPRRDDLNYVYFTFHTNPTASEGGGANGALFGNHPSYGPGLFISRPGYNPLTASLADMSLSTRQNHFQFAETGIAYPTSAPGATHVAYVTGDPFIYSPLAARRCSIVNLSQAYPDYPPVIVNCTDYATLISCFWLSPTQILFSGMPADGSPTRYAIIASDPSYVPGIDAVSVRRCYASEATGFGVTKHNVDALSATGSGWLFRSDRVTPYLNGFETFYAGRVSGVYGLPAPAPANAPLALMMTYEPFSGWWCGVNGSTTYHVFQSGSSENAYGPIYRGYIMNNSQYFWYWDSNFTTSVTNGYIATTNVSDF